MAGKLVQIATETVTSAVASVTLTGIDSDDVYMVASTNVIPSTDGADLQMRFTESGTANSTSNYDHAFKFLTANTAFSNSSSTNQNKFDISGSIGKNTAGESLSQIQYIYNANNSSEYSFFTIEQSYMNNGGSNHGNQGGGAFTVSSAVDGVNYFMDTGNIESGTFTLYKVV